MYGDQFTDDNLVSKDTLEEVDQCELDNLRIEDPDAIKLVYGFAEDAVENDLY